MSRVARGRSQPLGKAPTMCHKQQGALAGWRRGAQRGRTFGQICRGRRPPAAAPARRRSSPSWRGAGHLKHEGRGRSGLRQAQEGGGGRLREGGGPCELCGLQRGGLARPCGIAWPHLKPGWAREQRTPLGRGSSGAPPHEASAAAAPGPLFVSVDRGLGRTAWFCFGWGLEYCLSIPRPATWRWRDAFGAFASPRAALWARSHHLVHHNVARNFR